MSQGHAKILAEAASLSPSALVELVILDASAIGGGVLRFHPGTDAQCRPLVFRGESYTPLPVKCEGFSLSGSGELPRPTLTFANLLGTFTSLSQAYGDLVNARVIRRLVFARNLDGMPEADSREMFQEDIYFVERKLRANRMEVTYELVPATDIDGAKVPRRQVIAAACVWRYRSPVGCAYVSNVALADKDNNLLPSGQTFRSDPAVNDGQWSETVQYYTKDTVFLWQDYERTTKSYYTLTGDSALGEEQGPLRNLLWKADQCSHRLSGCKLRFDPNAVLTSTIKPTAIASGQRANHNLLFRSDASLRAWGSNTNGQTTLPSGVTTAQKLSVGDSHSAILKPNGVVVVWGYNGYGQTNTPANLTAIDVSAGGGHTVALKADGTVVCWGWDYAGQTSGIPSGLTGVTAVVAGYLHTLALKSDGTVVGWGQSAYGQTAIPSGLSGVIAIACGEYHNLALKSDGTVVGWGSRSGITNGADIVPSGLSSVVGIACGLNHSLAVKSDGSVVAWGDNAQGQCTVPPDALTQVVKVTGGQAHSLALKSTGAIVGWGRNVEGQLTLPPNLVETISVQSSTPLPFGGFPGSNRVPR